MLLLLLLGLAWQGQEASLAQVSMQVQVTEVGVEQDVVMTTSTLIVGGNKTEFATESVGNRTLCHDPIPPFPAIRFASSGCYLEAPSPSILICGGRQDLFSLSSDCWTYSWQSREWQQADSLPFAVAGAATVCLEDSMMIVGGVVEEDYYQDTGDYYDYNTEVASSGVLQYSVRDAKWETGDSIPEPRQGACAVSFQDQVILTGGKNDKDCGYGTNTVWTRNKMSHKWTQGPQMNIARFHHGCMLTTYNDQVGVMVMGGLGQDNAGDSVEFLQLSSDTQHQWQLMPRLSQPHPNQPIAAHLAGLTVLIGGGGFPYPGGEHVAEILTPKGWEPFIYPGVERAFAAVIQVPTSLMENCEMEPNFGHHHYFRRQGELWLDDKVWFCDGDRLQLPLLTGDTVSGSGASVSLTMCTVPGCQYYQIPDGIRTRAQLHCSVQKMHQSVECSLHCPLGYHALGGVSTSSCDRQSRSWDVRYLECQPDRQ